MIDKPKNPSVHVKVPRKKVPVFPEFPDMEALVAHVKGMKAEDRNPAAVAAAVSRLVDGR